ncbi:hypothetical protein CER18_06800 [Bartonella tribocorum]|uniref:Uncharacterized protein n=1 Tax=Bartonella tribocorum TaxID=85701 RepID=A0A2M6UQK4_9HYPH|nr:hypothetical protein CER18_06800 [Bartonella tribocorum]
MRRRSKYLLRDKGISEDWQEKSKHLENNNILRIARIIRSCCNISFLRGDIGHIDFTHWDAFGVQAGVECFRGGVVYRALCSTAF